MTTADLPPLAVLDRAAITECFDLFDEIERAIEALPYRVAVEQLGNLGSIREHLAVAFPGGLAGACDSCGELIGYDEIGASDHENGGHLCGACAAAEAKAQDGAALAAVEGAPAPTPEGDRLRAEASLLLEASAAADLIEDAIELRMDAARSAEAAQRADAAPWISWEAPPPNYDDEASMAPPVAVDALVDIRMGDGDEFLRCRADNWKWHSLNDPTLVITAYRLSEPLRPIADA